MNELSPMEKNVFLSYSWKDRQAAMRLYNDLVRSNVPVWRDQIDGDPTADFEDEFLLQIDRCNYFIMLDSINYRERSNWCCTEAKRCLENQQKRSDIKIIVCLLDEDGEWRRHYRNQQFKEVFEQINRLKYQKLCYTGYDNSNVYNTTLNFICDLLGFKYERWDKVPSYQDFMDELESADVTRDFDDTTSSILLDGYKNILRKRERNFPNIRESFQVWIEDCQNCKLSIFFPKWTYAVWLANQFPKYKDEAYGVFSELTKAFPKDPRGFRALGNISAFIGNDMAMSGVDTNLYHYYSDALEKLLYAERLMGLPENYRHRDVCLFEVLTNIGKLFQITLRDDLALHYWDRALEIMKKKNFFYEGVVNDVFVVKKKKGVTSYELLDWLAPLSMQYPLEPLLYQLSGLCYADIGNIERSLDLFMKAFSLNSSMENLYYLVSSMKALDGFSVMSKSEVRSHILNSNALDEKDWVDAIEKMLAE